MNTFRASKKVYRAKQKKMYWGRVIFLCLKDNPDIADTYSWCTTFVHKITTCMCVWLLKCVKGIAINRYECSYNAFTNFARFNFFPQKLMHTYVVVGSEDGCKTGVNFINLLLAAFVQVGLHSLEHTA